MNTNLQVWQVGSTHFYPDWVLELQRLKKIEIYTDTSDNGLQTWVVAVSIVDTNVTVLADANLYYDGGRVFTLE